MALELTDEQIDGIVAEYLPHVTEGYPGQLCELVVSLIDWYNGKGEHPDGPGLVITTLRIDLEKLL